MSFNFDAHVTEIDFLEGIKNFMLVVEDLRLNYRYSQLIAQKNFVYIIINVEKRTNKDSHVANFVESEQIVQLEGYTASFVHVFILLINLHCFKNLFLHML